MNILTAMIAAFFRPSIILPLPAGQQGVDATGRGGLIALWQGINNYAQSLSSVGVSGTTATLIASGQQASGNLISGCVMLNNTGATGAVTVTFPGTSAIMGALGAGTPQDGSYSEMIEIANATGQTVTVAGGDSNQTILGSTSIAAGSIRRLIMRVLNSSNLTFTNFGTWTF